MAEQKCISSVCATVLKLLGVEVPGGIEAPNDDILNISERADCAVLYNPDAIGWWLYEKYPQFFAPAKECSALDTRLTSVMPSVTPVCFASMYSGLTPDGHGIKKYEKPVLTCDTLFDILLKAGKKCAIVSTAGDSISKIFLERNMGYYIYSGKAAVNRKAKQLIKKGGYDLIVIYNPDYDSTMHSHGPEHSASLRHLKANVKTYSGIVDTIKASCGGKKVFYGFCPDHGCHLIDGNRGSHGLDMYEDMNVIHFYGFT